MRLERLAEEGRLVELGLRVIALAKVSRGRNANPDVDAPVIPADLSAELDRARDARRWFDESAPSFGRNVLRWIVKAQRPETRAARIAKVVETAQGGDRI